MFENKSGFYRTRNKNRKGFDKFHSHQKAKEKPLISFSYFSGLLIKCLKQMFYGDLSLKHCLCKTIPTLGGEQLYDVAKIKKKPIQLILNIENYEFVAFVDSGEFNAFNT